MYHASNKAQRKAQEMWDATHSLHSAVNAGCDVTVDEILKELRESGSTMHLYAVRYLERALDKEQQ